MIPYFPHNIKIRLAQLRFFFVASWLCKVSALLAVSAKLSKPTRQRLCKVKMQQKKIQCGQSYFYNMRNVCYHQIWIQNYFGFIVLILVLVTSLKCLYCKEFSNFTTRWHCTVSTWKCCRFRTWCNFKCGLRYASIDFV